MNSYLLPRFIEQIFGYCNHKLLVSQDNTIKIFLIFFNSEVSGVDNIPTKINKVQTTDKVQVSFQVTQKLQQLFPLKKIPDKKYWLSNFKPVSFLC